MKRTSQGFLIVLEGIDGSGKSTLTDGLSHALKELGYAVVQTREPGGSSFGVHLRQILQHSVERPTAEAQFLLFAADRAHHIATVVQPALQQGSIVISDRMADSSMAYQGYGHGVDRAMIATVNRWAMQGIEPDLILYIDLDWQTALQRIQKGRKQLTAFEQEQDAFFERVAAGFKEIFHHRTNIIKINGSQTPATILQQAIAEVTKVLERT